MDEERKGLVEQFAAIAGVDQERAKFYLESSAWSIETALGSFYENQDEEQEPSAFVASSAAASNTNSEARQKDPDMLIVSPLDDSGNSSSDEEGQAFYAGGSEHSGQQLLGPSKKKKDVVSRLFRSAKEHGAEVVDPKSKTRTKKLTFMGTGYRLGENETDHEVVANARPEQRQTQEVALKMWKEGFSLDDGPIRKYEDAENSEFLKSVMRGEIPLELVRKARGGEVYINMEDHRHEEFVQPRISAKAFSGEGHSLGSLAPSVVGQVQNVESGGMASSSNKITEDNDSAAKASLNLQADQPTTNIQLRLPDGSRLIAKLNHTHTVGDIRSYVVTARPQLAASPFAIMTTFPHAELTNESLTLADGKLLNSALVIKIK